jgi:hypothetical protein
MRLKVLSMAVLGMVLLIATAVPAFALSAAHPSSCAVAGGAAACASPLSSCAVAGGAAACAVSNFFHGFFGFFSTWFGFFF